MGGWLWFLYVFVVYSSGCACAASGCARGRVVHVAVVVVRLGRVVLCNLHKSSQLYTIQRLEFEAGAWLASKIITCVCMFVCTSYIYRYIENISFMLTVLLCWVVSVAPKVATILRVEKAVFPALQGGPHNATIGALAFQLREARVKPILVS